MNKRILVVEDQPDNRQIIRDMLAPTDYEITEVESGEEAANAVTRRQERRIDGWPAVARGIEDVSRARPQGHRHVRLEHLHHVDFAFAQRP